MEAVKVRDRLYPRFWVVLSICLSESHRARGFTARTEAQLNRELHPFTAPEIGLVMRSQRRILRFIKAGIQCERLSLPLSQPVQAYYTEFRRENEALYIRTLWVLG